MAPGIAPSVVYRLNGKRNEMACAALMFAAAVAAQPYQPHAIHTPAEAVSAAYRQVNEFQSRTRDLDSWAWPFMVEHKGDQWILHRRAYEPKDIFLDAKSGRILKIVGGD
jgi:hypothetical protein